MVLEQTLKHTPVVFVSENNIIFIPITRLNCDNQNHLFIGNDYTFYWPQVDKVKEAIVDKNWTKISGKLLNIAGKIVINLFLYFNHEYLCNLQILVEKENIWLR